MREKISIVVPIFNKGPYLFECLQSLQNQTYAPIEILLVDDGSTDESAEICKSFCEKDSRFRYLYQENQGQVAARKAGAEASCSSWVIFVDADDMADSEMCSHLMAEQEKTHAAVVVGVVQRWDREKKELLAQS